jgi:hypothetical protein
MSRVGENVKSSCSASYTVTPSEVDTKYESRRDILAAGEEELAKI